MQNWNRKVMRAARIYKARGAIKAGMMSLSVDDLGIMSDVAYSRSLNNSLLKIWALRANNRLPNLERC